MSSAGDRPRKALATRTGVGIALGCAVVVLLLAVAVAAGRDSESNPSTGDGHVLPAAPNSDSGAWHPVHNDEALPCTRPGEPVNFETFSAGPSVSGLPLTHATRRCDGGPVAGRANYVSYIYGDCEIPKGATGCQPPLEIQSWPACQRFFAKYSFAGKPPPHRRLPKRGGAVVVELDFALDKRIEVYTDSATIAIFAVDRDLAVSAVEGLRPREQGKPPATNGGAVEGDAPEWLAPPAKGSMKGDLSCQT